MSSHHFVREGQEAPLLVLAWNDALESIAKQLLEWQPLFVIHQNILDNVLASGLKPDVILGLKNNNLAYLEPIEFKDADTFLSNNNELNIITDESLESCLSYFTFSDRSIYTPNFKLYKPKNSFNKWMPDTLNCYLVDIKTGKSTILIPNNDGLIHYSFEENTLFLEEI